MLAEHKGLAVLFTAVALVFTAYCLKTQHPTHARDAPGAPQAARAASEARSAPTQSAPTQSASTQPIYVESLP